MYFCLNFDTRKEHKANAMKFNKISFCPSAHYVFLSKSFQVWWDLDRMRLVGWSGDKNRVSIVIGTINTLFDMMLFIR